MEGYLDIVESDGPVAWDMHKQRKIPGSANFAEPSTNGWAPGRANLENCEMYKSEKI